MVIRWCRAAVAGLAAARAEIDALNVYPVPDADTGSNLLATMTAGCAALESSPAGDDDLGAAMQRLARAALVGACGNAGVILAAHLGGAAHALAAVRVLDGPVLARALAAAADAGCRAVAQPVDGTILTVSRAAADAALARTGDDPSLSAVSRAALDAARTALAHTTAQLEPLRRAGVVDAGGRGLVVVLEALDDVVCGRPLRAVVPGESAPVSQSPAPSAPVHEDTRRHGPAYEVMFLLDASAGVIPRLSADLAALGDSLVVTGGAPEPGAVGDVGLWSVHVHVDDAGAAVEAGLRSGHPHRIRVTYLAAGPPAGRRVVAVAAGPGIAELFAAAGALVLTGGPDWTLTPAELAVAIRDAAAAEVVVLPNDPDGVVVAEQAAGEARRAGIRVAVVPSRTQVQGLAACAVHQGDRSFDDDLVAMTSAAGHARHGAVTVATREVLTSVGMCHAGDVLGIVQGDVVSVGDDVAEIGYQVVERLLVGGGELVTVVGGADGGDGGDGGDRLAEGVVDRIRAAHPDVDAHAYAGGQPRYPLLLGVE
ncbi:MAG TPA: DAK2 domain-containing protein [Actinopolymorphaceae bacterium]|nr:DAK2 domain-containing protein [Actinopolymorphaceae bacterium]